MNEGQIEQVGRRPESVFERPESKFVASFLGRASFLEGHLRDGKVETGIGRFDAVTLEGYDTVYDGTPVDVLVRPDDLRASDARERRAGRRDHRLPAVRRSLVHLPGRTRVRGRRPLPPQPRRGVRPRRIGGLGAHRRSPAGLVPAVGESLSAVLDDY